MSVATEQTLFFIKPDAFRFHPGLVRDVIPFFKNLGLKIVAAKTMNAPRELAEEHYLPHKGKDFYDPLIDYTISGSVFVMVLEGAGAIEEVRKLLGDTDPEKARTSQPESLRAQYGSSDSDDAVRLMHNGFHASDSLDSAQNEISLWFPNIGAKKVNPQQTLVFVKPKAHANGKSPEILQRFFLEKGCKLVAARTSTATKLLAKNHYGELKAQPFYDKLIDYTASEEVFAMVLEHTEEHHDDAVEFCRKLCGDTDPANAEEGSVRFEYGLRQDDGSFEPDDEKRLMYNVIHASDSVENAIIEIALWFPEPAVHLMA